MRTRKRLLGFGRAGWLLLAVAVPLAVLVLFTENPDLRVISAVRALFGEQAADWTQSLFGSHRLNAVPLIGPSPMFGLWGLAAVLVAFQIAPKRIRWWWRTSIVLFALVSPLFGLRDFPIWLSMSNAPVGLSIEQAFLVSYACSHLLLITLLTGATRSKLVFGGVVLLGIAAVASVYTVVTKMPWLLYIGTSSNGRIWFVIAGWAWSPLLLAVLLAWAIPARLHARKWYECVRCRYDMRNLNTNTCPECGTLKERAPESASEPA